MADLVVTIARRKKKMPNKPGFQFDDDMDLAEKNSGKITSLIKSHSDEYRVVNFFKI